MSRLEALPVDLCPADIWIAPRAEGAARSGGLNNVRGGGAPEVNVRKAVGTIIPGYPRYGTNAVTLPFGPGTPTTRQTLRTDRAASASIAVTRYLRIMKVLLLTVICGIVALRPAALHGARPDFNTDADHLRRYAFSDNNAYALLILSEPYELAVWKIDQVPSEAVFRVPHVAGLILPSGTVSDTGRYCAALDWAWSKDGPVIINRVHATVFVGTLSLYGSKGLIRRYAESDLGKTDVRWTQLHSNDYVAPVLAGTSTYWIRFFQDASDEWLCVWSARSNAWAIFDAETGAPARLSARVFGKLNESSRRMALAKVEELDDSNSRLAQRFKFRFPLTDDQRVANVNTLTAHLFLCGLGLRQDRLVFERTLREAPYHYRPLFIDYKAERRVNATNCIFMIESERRQRADLMLSNWGSPANVDAQALFRHGRHGEHWSTDQFTYAGAVKGVIKLPQWPEGLGFRLQLELVSTVKNSGVRKTTIWDYLLDAPRDAKEELNGAEAAFQVGDLVPGQYRITGRLESLKAVSDNNRNFAFEQIRIYKTARSEAFLIEPGKTNPAPIVQFEQ